MSGAGFDVVTGAFGYTGRYIAAHLLATGRRVRTLTGRPGRHNPLGSPVEVARYDFDRPADLVMSLEGADTLYNTYWVRFVHGQTTFQRAVENSRVLFEAAAKAGVGRVVHVSITNPIQGSPLPYFRGKAAVEKILVESGLPYGIVRPTVIFGREDVFINNIAWILRHFPVFTVPGSGGYRIQPVHVEDVARLCVEAGAATRNVLMDAAGQEIFTFEEMVRLIARAVRSRARVVHAPSRIALALSGVVGSLVRDVLLTREELEGLMGELVVSADVPLGRIRLSRWLGENAERLGRRYASELGRHYRAQSRPAGAATETPKG